MSKLDFSSDTTTQVSATIRRSIVNKIEDLVREQKSLQPENAHKINRSSVMTVLLEEALEARANG